MAASPKPLGLFLRNELTDPSGRTTFDVVDPSDGSLAGAVVRGSADDARAAMEAAAAAQPAWEALGGAARGAILRRAAERLRARAEELAVLVTREMGKVLHESRSEVGGAIDNLDYYADFGRTLTAESAAMLPKGETLRFLWLARGVVVAITPWNFPAATVTRKIAPALVAGNTMVLKPSSNTPMSSLLIAQELAAAGLPPGVLNVVTGPGSELGPALIGHPACATVTLTGSTASGIEVLKLAAPRVVKCLLELGGKAPVLVADDADLDAAARAIVFARFWNAGQACIAAERLYASHRTAEALAPRLAQLVGRLRVGPGLSGSADIGPLYSIPARDAIARSVEGAVSSGASLVTGGRRPKAAALSKGAFYEPTLLAGVDDRSSIAQEEIFGPVLPIIPCDDLDEAIDRSNASRYGLSSYLFTKDLAVAERVAHLLRFGETYINRAGPESPQGYHAGLRESGLGGEGSRRSVEDYLQLKTVYVDWGGSAGLADPMPYGPQEKGGSGGRSARR